MLSKGHAVAALASIYAELGYFDRVGAAQLAVVREHPQRPSRADPAGHPYRHRPDGPGLRRWRRASPSPAASSPRFDAYCLTGDGELQEGPIWEAVMYAGQKHLDNLCVMVDRNNGQLDIANRMVFPMPELEAVFASFDWQVHSVDATQYDGVYAALEQFRYGPRNGKPTAIICHGMKGHGALSDFLNKHKVTVPDAADRAGAGAAGGAAAATASSEFNAFSPAARRAADGGARAGRAAGRSPGRCTSTSRRTVRRAVAARR